MSAEPVAGADRSQSLESLALDLRPVNRIEAPDECAAAHLLAA